MTEHIVVRDEDATRFIAMKRPDKKNALTQSMYLAMSAAIDSAKDNAAIRGLAIEGVPGAFTAGNDLEDFLHAGTSKSSEARPSAAMTFLRSLANNTKPLIAAVDGIAVGIGTTMIFHCDYVIASSNAKFSTPFIHLGLVPEGASSLLMPRAMGHHRAFATLVMGRPVTAADAKEAGFVNDVVAPDQIEAVTKKVAREICALPAEAVAISRKLLKPSPEELLKRIEHESALFGERLRSEEAVTAFKSFLARKRA